MDTEEPVQAHGVLISSAECNSIVKDFVLLKSFDMVSSGQYRKFVLRRKDLCEQWAMSMHDNYHMMTQEVRNISKYVVMARSRGHIQVGTVCTKLLNCVECPHAVVAGWNTCSITNCAMHGWNTGKRSERKHSHGCTPQISEILSIVLVHVSI
jgi:hypothetical protein